MESIQPMNLSIGGAPTQVTSAQVGNYLGRTLGASLAMLNDNLGSIMQLLLVVGVIVMIVVIVQSAQAQQDLMDAETSFLDTTVAYMNVAYHQNCKSRGACCRSCPFITEDDPRLIIVKQMTAIDGLYDQTQRCVADDKLAISNALDKVQARMDSNNITESKEATDTRRAELKAEWEGIIKVEQAASEAIRVLLSQLKTLDNTFGEVKTLDVKLIDAKNKATALGAAAVIQKDILTMASLHLNAQIMLRYIRDVSREKQRNIVEYDLILPAAAMAANDGTDSLRNSYGRSNDMKPTYLKDVATVDPAATSSSQDIIASMASLISDAHDRDETLKVAVGKLNTVSSVFKACRSVVDRFSNDLPGKMSSDKMTQLIQNGDYESAIIQTALESDIVSNHKKFAKERSSFESGGGIQSVRDDDNDVVPWVGLFGRPTYRKSNGDSVDISLKEDKPTMLRSIPSDIPDHLMRSSTLRLGSQTFKR